MDISQALVCLLKSELHRKDFPTGFKGFFATGEVTANGVRYQVQAQAVLAGSKSDPTATVEATTDDMAAALADLVIGDLGPRTFNGGNTGYRAAARVAAHGQYYQVSVLAVRLR
ncbi:hypothetical protein HII36_44285 [Nonomuraea sp. NN258]|uniref:hypothetical protein n=1 Tax=Nonomuraea antri TaxID=2730852 RepID=UPI00156931B7|nr:hypothetical protein [Nonomuraea antri]NRQ38796.1 hypothetical protein [Nonomuraea antri]